MFFFVTIQFSNAGLRPMSLGIIRNRVGPPMPGRPEPTRFLPSTRTRESWCDISSNRSLLGAWAPPRRLSRLHHLFASFIFFPKKAAATETVLNSPFLPSFLALQERAPLYLPPPSPAPAPARCPYAVRPVCPSTVPLPSSLHVAACQIRLAPTVTQSIGWALSPAASGTGHRPARRLIRRFRYGTALFLPCGCVLVTLSIALLKDFTCSEVWWEHRGSICAVL
jgi:hypothetical protein